MREYLNETKSVPCKDCGQSYPPYVMDFDHRDPSKKKYTISMARGLWTWKSLRAEVAKCDVVCSNCHRIRTHGLCDSKKAKRAKTGT